MDIFFAVPEFPVTDRRIQYPLYPWYRQRFQSSLFLVGPPVYSGPFRPVCCLRFSDKVFPVHSKSVHVCNEPVQKRRFFSSDEFCQRPTKLPDWRMCRCWLDAPGVLSIQTL